ncbi:MAG: hypothetical protein AAGA30_10040, partial [Planctomycetota bacterium]
MQEYIFPALTGLTLVFAGILVGYFLWFRDRSEQLLFREQIATENEQLKSQLRTGSAREFELEEELSRAKQKLANSEQLCDDLVRSREKLQLQNSEHESDLYTIRDAMELLRSQVSEECRLRAETEAKLLQNQQIHLESSTKLERDWKAKLEQTNQALNHYKNEYRKAADQGDYLAEKLHTANSSLAELQSELDAQREILDAAKTNAVGLEKEYVSLETSVRSQLELLNEARGQAAAALSAKNLAEESLQDKKEQIEELREQMLIARNSKIKWEEDA